jgi:hypothetical protein
MLAAQGENAHPHYRYRLVVDVEPVDMRMLRDALEDEPLGLRERYGMAELDRQLANFELSFHTSSTKRWDDFEADIGILSVYLSQYIVGHEIEVEPTRGAPRLRASKIVGCRGETVRLAVHVHWDHRDKSVALGDEDLEALAERWEQLPEWLRNALRLKHPQLTAL